MKNTGSDRGGAKPAIRFGFSWADEVEREEREQQQEEEQRRWETEREQIKADPFGGARPREVEQRRRETEREQIKADPFGAARPREVVLAEKGVDWRARDRELDLHLRTAPRPRPRRSQKHAAATATSKGAVAAHGATPARGAPWDRDAAGLGRTPHPKGRRAASSTPLPPPTVSHSAWGGSKRKCAGEGTGPSRRVRPVDDQRRKVFGELNVGEGCASSIRASSNKGCDSGGSLAQGIKSSMPAVADGENRCSMVPATKVTTTEADESAIAQKRKGGGKRRKGKRSKKTPNQQTLADVLRTLK
ncbi:unnamed protein product [Miscanthus lutarioriparius]|uniref:Uncharacterized protein n=1 Tax=Miscanthus lutarioriparius TaxID=422564 RepID=A0A811SNS3_9POAL|nr:unnamed protein product [Miscanthus lutarioriparius]